VELMEPPNNSSNCLSSIVASTEPSMQFSSVQPTDGSAMVSSSQPVPCRDGNSSSNDITRVENMALVNGSMIVEGAMSFGGSAWYQ